ncbi:hypothetical protein RIR_jg27947.t1 [Rhizophagus irregularis DAOM 181602=DAOM 197198]|nr:hypothetical protein RIR_jg27947.t1 [Rhizophagus irregularis DAOM 181602=DAOM 197198]
MYLLSWADLRRLRLVNLKGGIPNWYPALQSYWKIVATLLKDKKLIGFEEQSAVTIEGLLHRATTCGTSKLKKNLVII